MRGLLYLNRSEACFNILLSSPLAQDDYLSGAREQPIQLCFDQTTRALNDINVSFAALRIDE